MPQAFGGKIERNAAESTPYWPMRVVPPKGAPNVLLIMTDDTGFGVSSTFGGVIPTPNLDRIAKNGLRYTNFNSTALCSPTRAALAWGLWFDSTRMAVHATRTFRQQVMFHEFLDCWAKERQKRIWQCDGVVTQWRISASFQFQHPCSAW
jgi:hypothetical protein